MGGAIVDQCIPYSLEYYLGVKDEGDDNNEEDDEDEDDEDEEDEAPKQSKNGKKGAAAGDDGVEKPECKQQ